MSPDTYTACVACGDEASGTGSLPVDTTGQIVSNDYGGAWAGAPACAACFALHAAVNDATGKADERDPGATVRAVLDAYDAATRELRRKLYRARADLKLIGGTVREALDDVGEHPAVIDDEIEPPVLMDALPPAAAFVLGTRVRLTHNNRVYRRARDVWQLEPFVESPAAPSYMETPQT